MAVTPIAWNHAAWADLTGYRIGPTCEAIRLALVERATAVGVAVPAALNTALDEDFMPTGTWASAVDGLITTLIPQYLNTGLAAPYAAWSEATMLTAISAGSRILFGAAGYEFRAVWVQQVWAIVNKLLAYDKAWAYGTGSARGVNGVSGRSWADTVIAFNATAWGSATPGPIGHYAYQEATFFIIKRTRRSYSATVPVGAVYERWVEISGSLAEVNTNPNGDVFEDNDNGWSEGWNLADSGTFGSTPYAWTVGDFGDATVTQPGAEEGRGWRIVQVSGGTQNLIIWPAFTYI